MKSTILSLGLIGALTLPTTAAEPWKPADGSLATRWAKDVSPDNALPEYPRPRMVRRQWKNLNGLWQYAIRPKSEGDPKEFDGRILVPYPVESSLSGVMKRVGVDQRLWYRRTFPTDESWRGGRLLLHFGAADWETIVWVNGKEIGRHQGGYDPFTFDVTEALKPDVEQELVVAVWDPTDAGPQPRGKQVHKPGGIFYTPTTGIWQTVWLEPVPKEYIKSIKIAPDVDQRMVHVDVVVEGATSRHEASVILVDPSRRKRAKGGHGEAIDGEPTAVTRHQLGQAFDVPVKDQRLWSPDDPFLYGLRIQLFDGDKQLDEIVSYVGMRKVSLESDRHGTTRIFLNGKPQFMFGPLDQGFWPDGLYTAPTDEALRFDIEMTKRIGFNMCRKHVKVEPARWYYWCDKLGLMVWQDMPSGDAGVAPGQGEIQRSSESAAIYERELKAMIDVLDNSPAIVMWVVFNEGWGQFDTQRITEWTKRYDPTRLVNCASGWNDFPTGDVIDMHNYPGPGSPRPESNRAAVLGEYGGLGLPLEGHTWLGKDNWGYRSFTDRDSLADAYFEIAAALRPLVAEPGLSAAVYTQTTDVETEVNGLMTYDRDVVKIDPETMAAAHRRLYRPPPVFTVLAATSEREPQAWHYTLETPGERWMATDFDDSAWKRGPGGFGTKTTPGAVARTEWNTPDIWLRREVELPKSAGGFNDPHLMMHHDEEAEIYVNGVLASNVTGYTTRYLATPLRAAARAALRPGRNVIAVHCKQTGGGQYIDVGLAEAKEQEP
ncbi:MAG TPA: glycoside hydrolase family 2 TIM barrel-domain containing protein [Pirellulales bacterium]|nr:glycoside hydrolase family 2 TIM barrel-domain containing protein [Pirellulales bacterium]